MRLVRENNNLKVQNDSHIASDRLITSMVRLVNFQNIHMQLVMFCEKHNHDDVIAHTSGNKTYTAGVNAIDRESLLQILSAKDYSFCEYHLQLLYRNDDCYDTVILTFLSEDDLSKIFWLLGKPDIATNRPIIKSKAEDVNKFTKDYIKINATDEAFKYMHNFTLTLLGNKQDADKQQDNLTNNTTSTSNQFVNKMQHENGDYTTKYPIKTTSFYNTHELKLIDKLKKQINDIDISISDVIMSVPTPFNTICGINYRLSRSFNMHYADNTRLNKYMENSFGGTNVYEYLHISNQRLRYNLHDVAGIKVSLFKEDSGDINLYIPELSYTSSVGNVIHCYLGNSDNAKYHHYKPHDYNNLTGSYILFKNDTINEHFQVAVELSKIISDALTKYNTAITGCPSEYQICNTNNSIIRRRKLMNMAIRSLFNNIPLELKSKLSYDNILLLLDTTGITHKTDNLRKLLTETDFNVWNIELDNSKYPQFQFGDGSVDNVTVMRNLILPLILAAAKDISTDVYSNAQSNAQNTNLDLVEYTADIDIDCFLEIMNVLYKYAVSVSGIADTLCYPSEMSRIVIDCLKQYDSDFMLNRFITADELYDLLQVTDSSLVSSIFDTLLYSYSTQNLKFRCNKSYFSDSKQEIIDTLHKVSVIRGESNRARILRDKIDKIILRDIVGMYIAKFPQINIKPKQRVNLDKVVILDYYTQDQLTKFRSEGYSIISRDEFVDILLHNYYSNQMALYGILIGSILLPNKQEDLNKVKFTNSEIEILIKRFIECVSNYTTNNEQWCSL